MDNVRLNAKRALQNHIIGIAIAYYHTDDAGKKSAMTSSLVLLGFLLDLVIHGPYSLPVMSLTMFSNYHATPT